MLPAREHEVVTGRGLRAEVLRQLDGDGVRQRYHSRLAPLWPVDDETGAHELHLLLDVDLLAEEVDVAHAQTEHLALAQATPCGHDRGRSVPVRKGVDHGLDSFGRPRVDLALLALGQLDGPGLTRVGGDEPVVDRGVEHRRDVGEDRPHVGGRQLLLQATDPRLDHRRLDRAELALAEVHDGVQAQPQFGRLAGRFRERLRLEPSLGEVGKGDLAGVRVDERAAQHVGGDGGEESLGVGLAGEVLGPFVAVGVAVAGLPPLALAVAGGADPLAIDSSFPPVLDVRHGDQPLRCAAPARERAALESRGLPGLAQLAGREKRSALARDSYSG